ncbi:MULTISPECIES: hypothetical protein [unclassified Spirosoma]|uniref:hypothetical protein n=1 Tax=unclassified Spirosoma TaxID=2621999 RepID=UPI000965288B|nr:MULTISPECIES: hypothetical protein [unclassified Spirosoma]MBN8825984.1 hypothetical protein [Spirosoma sp.]OJW71014.1 MAG: hypothetical protein BGO59_32895 [Spirosoma sp. 48-14]
MRSQFLTLLCVLTFLSCAWGIADAVISFSQTEAVSETTQIERKSKPDDQSPKQYYEDRSSGNVPLPNDQELVRLLAIASFFYSLITLIGAIFMFRLRRIGFWIYVAGVVCGFVLPVALAGFEALNVSFGVFFSLLFVGLYWLSFKEMH